MIRPQPAQGAFHSLADGFWAAGEVDGAIVGVVLAILKVKAEFGGDDHATPTALQGFAHEGLVAEGAVSFGGIEKGNSQLHDLADQGNGFAFGKKGRVALRQSHTTVAEGGHFEVARAKRSCFHGDLLDRADRIPASAAVIPSMREPCTDGMHCSGG